MSFKDVKRDYRGDKGTSSQNEERRTKIFTVAFDGNDTHDECMILAPQAPDIPRVGDAYSTSQYWLPCVSVEVDVESVRTLYRVTATFLSQRRSGSGTAGDEDPLKQAADVEWDLIRSTEPIDRDINGAAITNSAGEPFDPPPYEEVDDVVLRITRNEGGFSPNLLRYYKNTINSKSFLGAPPYYAYMHHIGARRVIQGDYKYWRVSYEIIFRFDEDLTGVVRQMPWAKRLLDQGYRQLLGVDGDGLPKYAYILAHDPETGEIASPPLPISTPVRLDGNGAVKAEADDDVWLEFETKIPRDWSALRLESAVLD